MIIFSVKKLGNSTPAFVGDIMGKRVNVVFENTQPAEGDIELLKAKIIIKGEQTFCYIQAYRTRN